MLKRCIENTTAFVDRKRAVLKGMPRIQASIYVQILSTKFTAPSKRAKKTEKRENLSTGESDLSIIQGRRRTRDKKFSERNDPRPISLRFDLFFFPPRRRRLNQTEDSACTGENVRELFPTSGKRVKRRGTKKRYRQTWPPVVSSKFQTRSLDSRHAPLSSRNTYLRIYTYTEQILLLPDGYRKPIPFLSPGRSNDRAGMHFTMTAHRRIIHWSTMSPRERCTRIGYFNDGTESPLNQI